MQLSKRYRGSFDALYQAAVSGEVPDASAFERVSDDSECKLLSCCANFTLLKQLPSSRLAVVQARTTGRLPPPALSHSLALSPFRDRLALELGSWALCSCYTTML